MNTSDDIFLLIKQYASGELDEQGRKDLEAALAERPDLRDELAFTQSLRRTTEKAERQRLLALIESVDSSGGNTDRPTEAAPLAKPRQYGWALLAAAALLVALALLWWFYRQSAEPLEKFQHTAYVEPSLGSAATRGGTERGLLLDAFREYEAGNYTGSLALLDSMPPGDSLYLYALFLRGHDHFRAGRYGQAIGAFDQLEQQFGTNPAYLAPNRDNAGWTRLLALLQLYEKEKSDSKKQALLQAIQAFLEGADNSDIYFKKATELQSSLKGD
ncbi:MAG: hypothetical protein H6577_06255 [Lewinellaceae bacterium]|nr:hypothetical protein [Saprospiraceae bacterium]MCB9337710.1 hypothetical protein [Lewinellaceae bacterium]